MAKTATKTAGAKRTGKTTRKAVSTRRPAATKAKTAAVSKKKLAAPAPRRTSADRAAQRLRVNKSRKRLGMRPVRSYEQVGRGRKPGTRVTPATRMKQSLSMKRFWKSTLGRKRKMKCRGKRGCPYISKGPMVAKAIRALRNRRSSLYKKVKSGVINIRGANEKRKEMLANMKKTAGKKRSRPAAAKKTTKTTAKKTTAKKTTKAKASAM